MGSVKPVTETIMYPTLWEIKRTSSLRIGERMLKVHKWDTYKVRLSDSNPFQTSIIEQDN